MDTKIVAAFLLMISVNSCHVFDAEPLSDTVAVYFTESVQSAYVNGRGVFQLRVEPSDSLAYYDVKYTVANEEVAKIVEATKRNVEFLGISPGSTVITAEIAEAKAMAVINVLP